MIQIALKLVIQTGANADIQKKKTPLISCHVNPEIHILTTLPLSILLGFVANYSAVHALSCSDLISIETHACACTPLESQH